MKKLAIAIMSLAFSLQAQADGLLCSKGSILGVDGLGSGVVTEVKLKEVKAKDEKTGKLLKWYNFQYFKMQTPNADEPISNAVLANEKFVGLECEAGSREREYTKTCTGEKGAELKVKRGMSSSVRSKPALSPYGDEIQNLTVTTYTPTDELTVQYRTNSSNWVTAQFSIKKDCRKL